MENKFAVIGVLFFYIVNQWCSMNCM